MVFKKSNLPSISKHFVCCDSTNNIDVQMNRRQIKKGCREGIFPSCVPETKEIERQNIAK